MLVGGGHMVRDLAPRRELWGAWLEEHCSSELRWPIGWHVPPTADRPNHRLAAGAILAMRRIR